MIEQSLAELKVIEVLETVSLKTDSITQFTQLNILVIEPPVS